MTKILAYDQTILSKLPHQTLTSLQCFTHAINYGHVDTQEILLTISTHPEHIAPNTIILDEKKLSHFADLPVQIEPLFIRLGRRQLTILGKRFFLLRRQPFFLILIVGPRFKKK